MTQTKTEYIIRKLLFASVLLLLVGCQRETFEWMDDNRPNPDGSMRFSLKTEEAEKETDQLQTRGTPQESLKEYNTVSVDVFSHTSDYATNGDDVKFLRNVLLQQKESKWEYTPSLFWPEGKKLSFIAYASDIPFEKAGIKFSPEEAPKTIDYTVPTTVTLQPDLLVSTKFNHTKVNNVTLTMKHALACVSFYGIAPEGSTYVKSITLRNVHSKGTLTLDDPSIVWTVDPTSKGITVFEAGINDHQELKKDTLPNYLMTENGYLMMIPQNLKDAGAAIDVLYWNKKDDTENKVITYTLPVDKEDYATWQPGKKYIYKFGNQSKEDITVVYYEKYAANDYGLYYYNQEGKPQSTLSDTKEILEAGYGVLSKKSVGNAAGIRLSSSGIFSITSGTVVELQVQGISSYLYPVSQSGSSTFTLPASTATQDVYFNGSSRSCGMIVPHFAKGVSPVKMVMKTHAIRTPQQMRNITASDTKSDQLAHTYNQELNLDFSKTDIGGGRLSTAVVNREFKDLFKGNNKQIENVDMKAAENGALFQHNSGEINEVILLNSSITSSGNTGGIAAVNKADGVITHARIIGEDSSNPLTITGSSGYTGAIAGFNSGKIIGDQTIEQATEIPIAEVSGWVTITGSTAGTGGITGQNNGRISTCLVNGVHVANSTVKEAQITITGEQYVGGIAGVNTAKIEGNRSENGTEPDVAGIVSISGSGNWVGGIAGLNQGDNAVLNQVNVRLGRGDANNAITIKGQESVGGIVGANQAKGELKADGNSFISVRGNVRITGTKMVGGIVGNNQTGKISNCFVYNFYSQTSPLVHYAPKITGEENVGGIVGYAGTGAIQQCAIFSTVSALNGVADDGTKEDVTNAVAEVNATVSSAGGIVGHGFTGLEISQSFVLGNVTINGLKNSGGFVGENEAKATITQIHIGNSGTAVSNIYSNLFTGIGLPVYDKRMKTDKSVMTKTSGTPTITGDQYVGGICGVNFGTVENVEIMDNVNIKGTGTNRNFVGGIAGGNGINAYIRNCKTFNPVSGGTVKIEGYLQVGGIVGLNNGIVEKCQLGLEGENKSQLITINGAGITGGIAGSTGGNVTGNADTKITDCNVYGKVLINGYGDNVGGILGLNQPTSRVINCNVTGYTSSYTNSDKYDYDVTVKGGNFVGGIAGTNAGEIYGSLPDSYCKVTHTAVYTAGGYAGGLVGSLKLDAARLYYCDVSRGVLILFLATKSGAFSGQLDGNKDAGQSNPSLFGTAPNGSTNRIYIGQDNPVRISGHSNSVKRAPPIGDLTYPVDPPTLTNLWADYLLWNYLYYTEYQ